MERHVQENVNKRKQNRRSLKKNKLSRKENKNNKPFVFIGNNCAKISNKIDSFNKVLHDLTPSVFALQETKRKKDDPPIKAENLKNYQVFELKREIEKKDGGKGLAGGGLAVGALHELNPVLTRIGNDEVEVEGRPAIATHSCCGLLKQCQGCGNALASVSLPATCVIQRQEVLGLDCHFG